MKNESELLYPSSKSPDSWLFVFAINLARSTIRRYGDVGILIFAIRKVTAPVTTQTLEARMGLDPFSVFDFQMLGGLRLALRPRWRGM